MDNWNIKQTFMYLEASFEAENGRNISIIWDKIIGRADIQKKDTIKIRGQDLKYPLRDMFRGLRGREVKISLHAEFMPIFGWISVVKK